MSDIFSTERFLDFTEPSLAAKLTGKVSLVREIDSTNTFLMNESSRFIPLLDHEGNLTAGGRKFNLNIKGAEKQTRGRGRLGREFVSPISSGIYFSFAFVEQGGITDPAIITVSSCIGVCRAIEKTYGIPCSIKWVNDIYCGSKKVCGILTEGIVNHDEGRIDGCICGIGINLRSSEDFGKELMEKAGGILDGVPTEEKTATRAQFLACCIREIFSILLEKQNVVEEYKTRSLLTGMEIKVTPVIGDDRSSYSAKVCGITDDFGLKVMDESGNEKILHSGEVSLHGTKIPTRE